MKLQLNKLQLILSITAFVLGVASIVISVLNLAGVLPLSSH